MVAARQRRKRSSALQEPTGSRINPVVCGVATAAAAGDASASAGEGRGEHQTDLAGGAGADNVALRLQ